MQTPLCLFYCGACLITEDNLVKILVPFSNGKMRHGNPFAFLLVLGFVIGDNHVYEFITECVHGFSIAAKVCIDCHSRGFPVGNSFNGRCRTSHIITCRENPFLIGCKSFSVYLNGAVLCYLDPVAVEIG